MGYDCCCKPNAEAFGARREINRGEQWVSQELAAPDAEMMLRQPNVVEATFIKQGGELAHLADQVAIRAPLRRIRQILEIAELHLRLRPDGPCTSVYNNTNLRATVISRARWRVARGACIGVLSCNSASTRAMLGFELGH